MFIFFINEEIFYSIKVDITLIIKRDCFASARNDNTGAVIASASEAIYTIFTELMTHSV